MSDAARHEQEVLADLEAVIGRVVEEVAGWRRRALKAEADRAALGEDHDAVASRARILELERHNAELTARLSSAQERVEMLIERLRFLEEQVALEESGG